MNNRVEISLMVATIVNSTSIIWFLVWISTRYAISPEDVLERIVVSEQRIIEAVQTAEELAVSHSQVAEMVREMEANKATTQPTGEKK